MNIYVWPVDEKSIPNLILLVFVANFSWPSGWTNMAFELKIISTLECKPAENIYNSFMVGEN